MTICISNKTGFAKRWTFVCRISLTEITSAQRFLGKSNPEVRIENDNVLFKECTRFSEISCKYLAVIYNIWLWSRYTYRESRVCGSWMFSIIVLFLFQRDSTGFAAASIDVRALSEQIIPALAIDRVCCSYISTHKTNIRSDAASKIDINMVLVWVNTAEQVSKPRLNFLISVLLHSKNLQTFDHYTTSLIAIVYVLNSQLNCQSANSHHPPLTTFKKR